MNIPFHQPVTLFPEEFATLANLQPQDSHGIEAVEQHIEQLTGAQVLLVSSCTHALEMAALLTISAGDEIILPAYTFVSAANAFVLRGAIPVFVDIDVQTLAIDPTLVSAAITPKTKAILVMHYGGVSANMPALLQIATENNLFLIEDAAHCIGAYDEQNQHLGAIGHLGALSFHYTKNIQCGEGGALLIRPDQPELYRRACILRDKGTNRKAFLQGQIDKYSWVDVGSSYSLSALQAQYLHPQLLRLDTINQARRAHWNNYFQLFLGLAAQNKLQLPFIQAELAHNAHVFYIRLADLPTRLALQTHLSALGIGSAFHYVPLHNTPYGQKVGRFHGSDKHTLAVADTLLRLPLYDTLTPQQVETVITAVYSFLK